MEKGIKVSAHGIIYNKLVNIAGRIEDGQEPTLNECRFVLDCYKVCMNEQVTQQLLDLDAVTTDDLKAAMRAKMLTGE